MTDEELVRVIELLKGVSLGYIPNDVRNINNEYIYKLVLLWVKGDINRISIYANSSVLGKWFELCQYLLELGSKHKLDEDTIILTTLKDRVMDIINVIVTGSFVGEHEDYYSITNLSFEEYLPQLINLYELLLNQDGTSNSVLTLLKSNNPFSTFLDLCTEYEVFEFYQKGVLNGFFPAVSWEEIQQVVDRYYKADLLDDGFILTSLIDKGSLEPYQLEYLLSKGCSWYIREAIEKNLSISTDMDYEKRVKDIKEWKRLDELTKQYPTVHNVAKAWYSLNRKDRKYLYNQHDREYTQVGESPLRIRSINLALVMAGVHEVTLTSRLPDYYNEEELNEV